MVGCGNSSKNIYLILLLPNYSYIGLSEMMYKEEYCNIVNIDISDVVIEKMNSTCNENFPKMKCKK